MRLVLTVAVLAFIAAFVHEVFSAVQSHRAARWPTTKGKLKRWHMHFDDGGEDTNIVIRELAYVYSVSGRDYESRNIGFGFPRSMSVLYLEKTLTALLKGAPEVVVFVDPANPTRSVLSVGVQMHHLVKVLGVGFIMAIVLSTWYAER